MNTNELISKIIVHEINKYQIEPIYTRYSVVRKFNINSLLLFNIIYEITENIYWFLLPVFGQSYLIFPK